MSLFYIKSLMFHTSLAIFPLFITSATIKIKKASLHFTTSANGGYGITKLLLQILGYFKSPKLQGTIVGTSYYKIAKLIILLQWPGYNYCYTTCLGRIQNLGSSGPYTFGCTQLKISPNRLRFLWISFFSPFILTGSVADPEERFVKSEITSNRSGTITEMSQIGYWCKTPGFWMK